MRRIWNKMAAMVVAAAMAAACWPAWGVMAADGDIKAEYGPTAPTPTQYNPPIVRDTSGDVADYDVYYVPSVAAKYGLKLEYPSEPTWEFADSGVSSGVTSIDQYGEIAPGATIYSNRFSPTLEVSDGNNKKTIRLFQVAAVDVHVSGDGTVELALDDFGGEDTTQTPIKCTSAIDTYFVVNYPYSNGDNTPTRTSIKATFTPEPGYVLSSAEWKKDGDVQPDITVIDNEMDIGAVEGHYYHLEVKFVETSIFGEVSDAKNNTFVEGAMVYALDSNGIIEAETKTAADGYYAFGGLTSGEKYTVVVCKPGFEQWSKLVTAPVGLAENVQLISKPVGHAIITVTDTHGNAVSGSTLLVAFGGNIIGPTTVEDNRCILGNLDEGIHTLIVSKDGYVTQMVELEVTANDVDDNGLMLKKTIVLASMNNASSGESRGFSFDYSAPETTPLPGTNPGLINIINQAVSNGDAALILHMGTGVGEGYRDLTPDVLAAIISSGLDVIFQYGSGFAVLIPNAVFQSLGSDELIRVALSNAELPQSALNKGGNIDPTNADLMKGTAFEVNMFRGGLLVGSFEGRRVNFAVNMGGFNLTEGQKSRLAGFRTDENGNLQLLAGKNGPRDFNFNSNSFSKYGVMIADAPVKAVDLRMTLDVKDYTVNGARKMLATPPEVIDGRVMVPLRFVAEDLGAEVTWDEALNKASVKLGDKLISVTAGVRSAGMDTKPVVVNDCLLVPIRFVAESLGCTVDWNEDTKSIAIMK